MSSVVKNESLSRFLDLIIYHKSLNSKTGFSLSNDGNLKLGSLAMHLMDGSGFKHSLLITKDELNTPYMEYMGLFIPSVFSEETQFEALQINPNEFNFTDLYLLATKDDKEYNIRKGVSYVINHLSPNKEFLILNEVKISTFSGEHKFINIPYVYLHQLFQIKIQPKNNLKYLQYINISNLYINI